MNATAVPTVSSLEETLTIPVVPHVTKFQDELSALLVNLRIMDDHGDDRDFIAQQFALQDQNGNGSIDFEGFKVRHLCARSAFLPGILSGRHRSPFGIFASVHFAPPARRPRAVAPSTLLSHVHSPDPPRRPDRLSTTRASTTARA